MILEIDAGNTFVKWRLLDGTRVVERDRFSTMAPQWSMPGCWQGVDQVRIASVAGPAVNDRLKALLADCTSATLQFASTGRVQAGVTNSYDDPARMGVDRWLVMLAAFNDCKRACCIVDCGSAITVDYLSSDGCHQGGYIIPGLRLMNGALRTDTAEIVVDQTIDDFSLLPGTHTSAAVVHGVNYLFNALCVQLCDELKLDGQERELYITGGDGALFHQLAGWGKYEPDLVMDGLNWSIR